LRTVFECMPDLKKNVKYSGEQSSILNSLLDILSNLTPQSLETPHYSLRTSSQEDVFINSGNMQRCTNNSVVSFLLCDLDENMDIQNRILGLCPEVKRVYPCSGCLGITGSADTCKRPYLSIVRFILKHHGKELYSCDYSITLGHSRYKRTKKYIIL
jgi:hypothetical protein